MKSRWLLILFALVQFYPSWGQPLSTFVPLAKPFPVPDFHVYDSTGICGQYYWAMAEVFPLGSQFQYGNVFSFWEPKQKTPVWYYWAKNYETDLNDIDEGDRWMFVADGKIQFDNSIALSITSNVKQGGVFITEWDGYSILNENFDYSWGFPGSPANANPITFPDNHDLQFNSQTGEWAYNVKTLQVLDISAISGNSLDTAVLLVGDEIQILSDTGLVLRWNVLDSIDIREVSYDFAQFTVNYTGGILNATHVNSVRWALDGNLLISIRGVGCMKIDRYTGKILWRLGSFFPGAARIVNFDSTFHPLWQHDFEQIKHGSYSGMYSVYSNGDFQTPAKALIFDINEQNLTATIVFQKPQVYTSLALGSVVLPASGGKIINWGHSIQQILYPDSTPVVEHLDNNDSMMLEIFFPKNVFPYYVACTENKIPRPQFNFYFYSGDSMVLRPMDPIESKWYNFNDSSVVFNDSIIVSIFDTSLYYMQQRVGIGIGVSDLIIPNKLLLPVRVLESSAQIESIIPYPNPIRNGQRMMNVPENAELVDLMGKKILLPKNGMIPANLPHGLYFLHAGNIINGSLHKIIVY